MKLNFWTNVLLLALLGDSTLVLALGSAAGDDTSFSAIKPHTQEPNQDIFLRFLPRAIIPKPKVPDSTPTNFDNVLPIGGQPHPPPPQIGGASDGTTPSSSESQPHIGADDDTPASSSESGSGSSDTSPQAGEDAPPA
ncbi:unnamed protein product [Zymoseptoria tritici ST99CH_1E4]|uniref:Uncharacterized protein n=1 Tax=Zymoseptoria tritici ST99CH_1E4 TaxID=1276532 RepID=A0A2H1GCB9_ZYMTR|nr:unnamed protein product [Zymoseptoria tritici ST99CH_1E4]